MNKKQRRKVLQLFMEEGDEMALKLLYKITNDELIKILLKWNKEPESSKKCNNFNDIYDELIEYVFKKFRLNKV